MRGLTRRMALAAGAAACLAGPASGQHAVGPFVRSDIGRLKRVLVHSVASSDHLVSQLGEDVLPNADTDMEAAVRQHAALITLMKKQGVEVVELVDVLDQAIAATRKSGVFAAWVEASFPRLGADPDKVTAAMLLGRDPSVRFRLGPDGSFRHAADATTTTIFVRDSAFMTPRGVVICNSASHTRMRENMLLRFLYAHSPLLKWYPIAFDAVEEGLIIEGGDAIVVDEKTLFVGVGSRTDPRIAPVLAKRLGMDVLAVQTRKADFLRRRSPGEPVPLGELRTLFLHLDTYFAFVGPKHVLAAPYVLEQAHAETSPLARYIRGARAETVVSQEAADGSLEMLKELGRVRLFRAETGAEEKLGDIKLVDHLREQGYKFTFTGGPPPEGEAEQFRHFMEVAYREHRRQATNVVQTAPGRVLAYAGNPATKAALEADGIKVDSFEARELWAWEGGPHCLTQPLERG